jgi:hypothetical protein
MLIHKNNSNTQKRLPLRKIKLHYEKKEVKDFKKDTNIVTLLPPIMQM